jgi:hypothetical protein
LQKNIEPRFEFGFGLSYTTFQYFNLKTSVISQPDSDSKALESTWAAGKPTPIAEGSSSALWLHRPLVQVQFEVQNTGGVDGGEVCPDQFLLQLLILGVDIKSLKTDSATLPAPPCLCGRASVRLERIHRCIPTEEPEEVRYDHAVEIRLECVGRGASRMGQAGGKDQVFCRREQQRFQADWHHSRLTSLVGVITSEETFYGLYIRTVMQENIIENEGLSQLLAWACKAL